MENRSLGKNLIYQRKLKGYTQEELSERTEVTVRTIQRIEKGDVNPHLHTVKQLAVALSIEVDELMVLENPKDEAIQKKWLLLMHATPLLGFVLPFCNVLFPLFLWIHKREDNDIYDRHGTKIVNFQITVLLLYVLSFVALLTIEKWGFFMFIAIVPICVLIVISNTIYAIREGKCYYPLAIPFLNFNKRRTSRLAVVLLIGITFLSCERSINDDIQRLDGTKISKESLTQKVKQLMREADVQGMALSVFNEKKPVYQRVFGYKDHPRKESLTDSTNIYGASLSKAVFSVLVMDLVEDGVIDLDTPLESYLPKKIYQYQAQTRWHDDFSDLKQDTLYHTITARMCLAHTTGFPNWRWIEEDQKLRTRFTPCTQYSYSGERVRLFTGSLRKIDRQGFRGACAGPNL